MEPADRGPQPPRPPPQPPRPAGLPGQPRVGEVHPVGRRGARRRGLRDPDHVSPLSVSGRAGPRVPRRPALIVRGRRVSLQPPPPTTPTWAVNRYIMHN